MDAGERKMMRELDAIVEEFEEQAEPFRETENWSVDGDPGPVSVELARYSLNLPDAEYFLELWNEVQDAAKNDTGLPVRDEEYSGIEERIYENESFIEQVYGFDKPLGKKKIEARYAW